MGFRGTLVADDRRFLESTEMGYLVCMERTSGMAQAGEALRSDIRALRSDSRATRRSSARKTATGGRCITTPIAFSQPLPVAASRRAAMSRPWFACGLALA
jgi:hypothetical protein